ncbi:MAG: hypothetical protein Q4D76_20380 [Oscillospiraceae bacterium]|nr:hypothetical protein [Oscillospiraceae bacterium]
MNLTINKKFSADIPNAQKQEINRNPKSVFAGTLNMNNSNQMINQKKESARKQAMKLMKDAFDKGEKKINAIQNLRDEKVSMKEDNYDIKKKIGYIDEEVAGLPEKYGVDAKSQEYKDYELLKKYQENKIGILFGSFSKEEVSRLKELQDQPLTAFQKEALSFNDARIEFQHSVKDNDDKIKIWDQKIRDAEIDLLKFDDIGEARKAADDILAAVDKDIINMMFEQVKNHVDEEFEEKKEKASKENDIEETNNHVRNNHEDEKEQEEIIEGQIEIDRMKNHIINSDSTSDNYEQTQTRIYNLMKENKMVNEDIKGIEIDLSF